MQSNIPSEGVPPCHSATRCGPAVQTGGHSQESDHQQFPADHNMDDDDWFNDAELIKKSDTVELLHSSSPALFKTLSTKSVLKSYSGGSQSPSTQPVAKPAGRYNRYKRQCPLYT